MKKFYFLLGVGALGLASCSNDEMVVNPTTDEAAESPIGFVVSTGNMSRAGANATPLADEYWEFGVWAYKTATPAAGDHNTVMDDYLVGYWDAAGTQGYEPTLGQVLYSTTSNKYWYYEGLGNTQQDASRPDLEHGVFGKGFFFQDGGTSKAAATAYNPSQYLKYWDKSVDNTWFYGYAPYSATVTFDAPNHKMTFPTVTAATGSNYMYAATKAANPKTAIAVDPGQYVDMTFYRLLSQIRVAFYETIPGYSVKLIAFNASNPDLYLVPTSYDGSAYSAGGYVSEAAPIVTFGGTDITDATISYATATKATEKIAIPFAFKPIDNPSAPNTTTLGTARDNAIVNNVINVLPAGTGANENDGFTLNVSLKLVADDTLEEIDVKGIRVYLPKANFQWKPNFLYTYYFKITKSVPGKPDDPTDPTYTPDDNPYLIPIVFDKVTVESFEDHTQDYDYEIL